MIQDTDNKDSDYPDELAGKKSKCVKQSCVHMDGVGIQQPLVYRAGREAEEVQYVFGDREHGDAEQRDEQ